MSIRQTSLVVGEFYHIYNRGNSKQKIFLDKKDHQRFIDLLCAVNNEKKFNFSDSEKGISVYERTQENPLVAIGAYCLMPNHFHILMTPLVEEGTSKFMQKLSTAYVMYFNKKYKRTGGLFEGKFKAEHAATDRHLKYLFSYIHLNPLKKIQKNWKEKDLKYEKQANERLLTYPYSSFFDYMGEKRIQNKILNKTPFPDYFKTRKDFLEEIREWISFRKSSGKT